jgi:dTDP-4-dehydrorhamnose 3,5-epimerase
MIKHETTISNCFWTEPKTFEDHRGIFSEIFKNSATEPLFKPVQSNYSFSKKGVLRGIHRTPYAKLVTCVKGTVYDVCVDLRKDSPTYRQHFGICLSNIVLNSLYIPPYCGHAFLALEDSILVYQQDSEYDKAVDETYCWRDYDIKWPMTPSIISDKDKNVCS